MRRLLREDGMVRPIADINMTNLVDVTLTLLVLFILVAPVIDQGFTMKLPSASAHPIRTVSSLTVVLDRSGNISLEGVTVTLNQLAEKALQAANRQDETDVVILADRSLQYGRVIESDGCHSFFRSLAYVIGNQGGGFLKREFLYSASAHLLLFCGVYFTASWVQRPKPRSIKPIEVKFIGPKRYHPQKSVSPPTPRATKRFVKPSLSTTNILRPTSRPTPKATQRARPRPTRRPSSPPSQKATKGPTKTPSRKATTPTKAPSRKPTGRPARRTMTEPTRRALPTTKPPEFGSSLLDKVKNAWAQNPLPTERPTTIATALPTVRPSLSLPTLPPVRATSAPTRLAAIPQGMRVGGAVPSSAGWYLSEIKEALDNNWIRPTRAAGEQRCEVTFVIRRNGQIGGISLSSPSQNESFNRSVLAAVQRIGQFKALPKGVGDKNGERFFLTFLLSAF